MHTKKDSVNQKFPVCAGPKNSGFQGKSYFVDEISSAYYYAPKNTCCSKINQHAKEFLLCCYLGSTEKYNLLILLEVIVTMVLFVGTMLKKYSFYFDIVQEI